MDKFNINPSNGDKVIDQYGVLWLFDANSKSWIDMGFLDIYGNVSREDDGLVYPILFEALEALDPDKFNGLKLADNTGASFYYFYSSDKTIKLRYEEHLGISKLRIEVSQSVLVKKFREFRCQGPGGKQGNQGIQGTSGIPATNELTHKLTFGKDGLVQIENEVATPLNTAVSLRLLRNQFQIAEFWVYQDGEVTMAFADGYSLKDGTTYDIYIYDNILYATFELDGDLTGIWTYKVRQTGPKGHDGDDGNWFVEIDNTEISDDNLVSPSAIFEITKSGSNVAFNISNIKNICATGLVPSEFDLLKFHLDSTPFVSAKYMVPNCRDIVRWKYTKPEPIIPDLNMPEWTPTECCPKTRIDGPPSPYVYLLDADGNNLVDEDGNLLAYLKDSMST